MNLRRPLFLATLATALLLFPLACRDRSEGAFTAEVDEPHFRRGEQLKKSGRNQEALAAYLKVIDRRGLEESAESHLEAGLIYLQHVNDPIAAIYHFNRYLQLRPNSPQAEHVRQRVDTAKKEFAKQLPGNLFESQVERAEMMELVERLKRENDQLKEELAASARQPAAVAVAQATPPPAAPVPPAPVPTEPAAVAPVPIATPAPPPTPPSRQPPTSPAAASGRRHVVAPKETLYSISLRYYGNGRRVEDIFHANRDVMRTKEDLRIGMTLRLP